MTSSQFETTTPDPIKLEHNPKRSGQHTMTSRVMSRVFLRSLSSQGRQKLLDRTKKAPATPFASQGDAATTKSRRPLKQPSVFPAGLRAEPNEPRNVVNAERPSPEPANVKRPGARLSRAPRPSVAAVDFTPPKDIPGPRRLVREPRAAKASVDPSPLQNIPGPRRVLEVRGVSKTFDQSATATHRRNRKVDFIENGEGPGGSVVASLSATAKHRQQRRVPEAAGTNPSSLTLPIAKSKPDYLFEKELTAAPKAKQITNPKEAESTPTESKSSSSSLLAATTGVVVGGIGYVIYVGDLGFPPVPH